MRNTIVIVLVLVAAAAFLWYQYGKKGLKTTMAMGAQEPVVLQGTGIRYQPYVMPKALAGGFYEWGKTPDGETVISKNDPATYQPWEWQ